MNRTYFAGMRTAKATERSAEAINPDGVGASISRVHPVAILITSLAIGVVISLAGLEWPRPTVPLASALRLGLIGTALFLAGIYVGQRLTYRRLTTLYPIQASASGE